jgi:energy-coupling factor transport system ATP-binding protein
VQLGRLAGWQPLPLSVRHARPLAAPQRDPLAPSRRREVLPAGPLALRAGGVTVRYGDVVAVREVSLDLARGQVCGLMGRNGSGKSSLLWALQGAGRRTAGSVDVDGVDPAQQPARAARALVGLVPQSAADLLYLDSVADELAQADVESGRPPGSASAVLDELLPALPRELHPRDLSEGQRLALVLAIQLVAEPAIVLLDEPTRGLDYDAKSRLGVLLGALARKGHAVVVSTHDVEFVAASCDRVVVLADGEVVADGPTGDVVLSSPAFAPQVAKVLGPAPWLTVAEVAAALNLPRPA